MRLLLDFWHYCNIIFDHPVCRWFSGFAQIVNFLEGSAADEVTAEDLAEHPEVQPVVATLDISPKFEFRLRVGVCQPTLGPGGAWAYIVSSALTIADGSGSPLLNLER